MLPHLKSLVQRLDGKPFAIIGVNSDGEAADLKPKFAAKGLTWRQAIDGDPFGPWASKWNVSGWPMMYVIDAQGVIRSRGHLEPEKLSQTVDALLAGQKPPQ